MIIYDDYDSKERKKEKFGTNSKRFLIFSTGIRKKYLSFYLIQTVVKISSKTDRFINPGVKHSMFKGNLSKN